MYLLLYYMICILVHIPFKAFIQQWAPIDFMGQPPEGPRPLKMRGRSSTTWCTFRMCALEASRKRREKCCLGWGIWWGHTIYIYITKYYKMLYLIYIYIYYYYYYFVVVIIIMYIIYIHKKKNIWRALLLFVLQLLVRVLHGSPHRGPKVGLIEAHTLPCSAQAMSRLSENRALQNWLLNHHLSPNLAVKSSCVLLKRLFGVLPKKPDSPNGRWHWSKPESWNQLLSFTPLTHVVSLSFRVKPSARFLLSIMFGFSVIGNMYPPQTRAAPAGLNINKRGI